MRSPFGNVKASADTRTPTQNKIFGKYQVLGFLGFSLFTKGHVIYFFGCGGANTQTQPGNYYIDVTFKHRHICFYHLMFSQVFVHFLLLHVKMMGN